MYLISNVTVQKDYQMKEATYRISFETVDFENNVDGLLLYLDNKL